VRIDFAADGKISVAARQPDFVLQGFEGTGQNVLLYSGGLASLATLRELLLFLFRHFSREDAKREVFHLCNIAAQATCTTGVIRIATDQPEFILARKSETLPVAFRTFYRRKRRSRNSISAHIRRFVLLVAFCSKI